MTEAALSVDPLTLLAILCMALVTIATRVGGFLAAVLVPTGGPLARALEAVPTAVLTALVAPTVIATGVAETVAALVTLGLAWRGGRLTAMAAGIVTVAGLRAFGL